MTNKLSYGRSRPGFRESIGHWWVGLTVVLVAACAAGIPAFLAFHSSDQAASAVQVVGTIQSSELESIVVDCGNGIKCPIYYYDTTVVTPQVTGTVSLDSEFQVGTSITLWLINGTSLSTTHPHTTEALVIEILVSGCAGLVAGALAGFAWMLASDI